MRAFGQGHVEIVRVLLEVRANTDPADNLGCTALITASDKGHVDIVRLLLAAAPNRNLADKET